MDLALAGAGAISVAHAISVDAIGSRITSVASRTSRHAEERAQQVGARPVTFDALPAGADAVIVCTPPDAHTELALRAIDAGAAVLIEKPLATTLADADAIVASGGRILYGENLVHSPVVLQVQALARTIGRPTYLELRFLSPRPTWGSFLDPARGGGVLFDLGCHPIALALLLLGDDHPVSVRASLSSSPGIEVDDRAELWLTTSSGATVRIETDWCSTDMIWDVQVSSDTGVVRADLGLEPSIEHDGEPVDLAPTRFAVEPYFERLGFVAQMQGLERLVAGDASAVDASFGRWVLDIECAAYASAGTGESVALPFTGRRDLRPIDLWRGTP